MSNELDRYTTSSLEERWNYATALSNAGDLLPQAFRNNAARTFWAFEVGSMLGIHPVAATLGINVIDGKPTLAPQLMSGVVRRAGHLIRVTTEGQLADLSLSATATLVRKDDPDHPFVVTWTIERAQRAGLLQVVQGKVSAKVGRNNQPGAWEKYTEAMLKARAISEVCREGGTDALMGVVYVPEELGAEVNEEGELVAQPAEPARREPPKASDYRPIALADPEPTPALAHRDEVVVVAEGPVTDQDMVEIYHLAEISTVIGARQAFIRARENGHLDRPVDGRPLGQWLQELAASLDQIQEDVNRQTGEVYETPPEGE